MNSPFANIFLAVQQQLQGLQNPDGSAMIAYIDVEMGQLEHYKLKPAMSFPSVLIDFDDWRFSQIGGNVQMAEGIVCVRLAFQTFSSTSQATPGAYKQAALNYFDIEYAMHSALQGWSPGDGFGYMERRHAASEKHRDMLRIRTIRYGLKFEDYSTQNALQVVNAGLAVSI